MPVVLSRRVVLMGAVGTAVAGGFHSDISRAQMPGGGGDVRRGAGPTLGEAKPFSFEILKSRARELAGAPHRVSRSAHTAILEALDYDPYQKIRIRNDRSLWLGDTPVQFFHLGKFFQEPVRVHVVEGASAREVLYSRDLYDMPDGHPARDLPDDAGFAGFRLMEPGLKSDWLSFLGASYFRASGPFDQYGLSARGLAIDTGGSGPEEFPRFTAFWLEPQKDGGVLIHALLDSPSVTGAFQIATRRTTDAEGVHTTTHDIALELFARSDIGRLGIAPFSSMYWYGEKDRPQAVDWRPEIHDSDGLAIATGSGERLWRPLNNPPRVVTSSFVDRDTKGFGLLQRDRAFSNYLDDGVFYERRASVWVTPGEGWGEGAVQLLEIPTEDEIHDNIAAWWNPAEPMKAGDERRFSYRLAWLDEAPFPEGLGKAIATFSGKGGRPGQPRPDGVRKFVIDFAGAVFADLDQHSGVEIDVGASRGAVSNVYCHTVVDQGQRWRGFFDIAVPPGEPAEVRVFLKRGGEALTETVLLQVFPQA